MGASARTITIDGKTRDIGALKSAVEKLFSGCSVAVTPDRDAPDFTPPQGESPDILIAAADTGEDIEKYAHQLRSAFPTGFLLVLREGAGDLSGLPGGIALTPEEAASPLGLKLLQKSVELWRSGLESGDYRHVPGVLAASPVSMIAVDKSGHITFFSQHYYDRHPDIADKLQPGIKVEDAYALIAADMGFDPDHPAYESTMEWWRNPRGYKEFQLGNGAWLRMQARELPDGSGSVISTTSITEYKRQQSLLASRTAELAVSLEKEHQVALQQRHFVSMVSHEFRTPLTIIDGNAQIIQRRGADLPPETLQKRAQAIRSSVDRLVHLIERILSANLSEIGKLSINPAPCDLSSVIRGVCGEQRIIKPDFEFNVEIADDVPQRMLLDVNVMHHIVTNLVSNAVKYSQEDKRVDLSLVSEGEAVVLCVQDYGVGIPKDELPQIFQRFFRASTSSGISGTGLGLSLVRDFVELHEGDIRIESAAGEGTAVIITLPARLPDAD